MTTRMDNASPGVFLERQLEHILPRVYQKTYAEIPYTRLVTVTNVVPEGADTFKYELWDHTGDFDLIADYGDDPPMSDVLRGEITNNIRGFSGGFKYSTGELRKAQFAGVNLEARKAIATRTSYEQRANRTALFGYAGTGLRGLFNHPCVDNIVVTGSANDAWFTSSATTPDQMLELLQMPVTYMVNGTRQVEKPDTLLLPYTAYRKASTTRINATNDTTVLEFFLRTNPYITQVEPINELDPANSFGNLSQPRMVVYKRSEEKVRFHIPMPLKFHPVQQKNLVYLVLAEAAFGGIELPYPKSMLYVTQG